MIALIALVTALQQAAPVFTPPGTHAYRVSSASMAPTLEEGDVVQADRPRADCGVTDFEPGDVVVALKDGVPHLRRIVATEGQRVQVVDGVLHVDGSPVGRQRLEVGRSTTLAFGGPVTVWRETLSNGRSYRIQDFGPDGPGDDTPLLTVREGHVFALGDSRDNALDDRYTGPTATSELCGVVTAVVRSPVPERVGTRP